MKEINKELLYTVAVIDTAVEYFSKAVKSGMSKEKALAHLETPAAQRIIKQRVNDILK